MSTENMDMTGVHDNKNQVYPDQPATESTTEETTVRRKKKSIIGGLRRKLERKIQEYFASVEEECHRAKKQVKKLNARAKFLAQLLDEAKDECTRINAENYQMQNDLDRALKQVATTSCGGSPMDTSDGHCDVNLNGVKNTDNNSGCDVDLFKAAYDEDGNIDCDVVMSIKKESSINNDGDVTASEREPKQESSINNDEDVTASEREHKQESSINNDEDVTASEREPKQEYDSVDVDKDHSHLGAEFDMLLPCNAGRRPPAVMTVDGEQQHLCPKCDTKFPCSNVLTNDICINERDMAPSHSQKFANTSSPDDNGMIIGAQTASSSHYSKNIHQDLQADVRTSKRDKPCPQCSKCFSKTSKLIEHVMIHARKSGLVCPWCNKAFSRTNDRNCHMRVHITEKRYSCLQCNLHFNKPSSFNRHMRKHVITQMRTNPHICPHCNISFNKVKKLTVHVRSHTGEKPYSCSQCSKCFVRAMGLCRHKKTHTGEKPYSCSQCSKCFVRAIGLRRHKKTHTGVQNKTTY